jgi:hypothetical protein
MTASEAPDDREPDSPSLPVRITLLTFIVYAALALLLIPIAHIPGPQIPGLVPLFVAGIFLRSCRRVSSCWPGSAETAAGRCCCCSAPISIQA